MTAPIALPVIQMHLTMDTVPPVAQRGKHVLILLRNVQKKFILGTKKHYPEGISRLVGGGMEGDEDPLLAAQRELEEETHYKAPLEDLKPLAEVQTTFTPTANSKEEKPILFVTYLFFLDIGDQSLKASDDLDGLAELPESEYLQLIANFYQLSKEQRPGQSFRWYDYGQLYGRIHQLAFDRLKALNL